MIHTIGNYEYGFYWYFYLDGTIQLEVKLTGVIGVSAVGDGGGTDTAPLVAPGIALTDPPASLLRALDPAIDGPNTWWLKLTLNTQPMGRTRTVPDFGCFDHTGNRNSGNA